MVVARPELFERLGRAARVTELSAPAGSGKTVLLRSWIAKSGLTPRAAWVPVQRGERDPQRFWIAVSDALRAADAASALVRPLTAAPDLDGWAIVERLLADLARLDGPVWLLIDDAHELASADAMRQLELLLLRAPPQLRFVLATRHDLQLGLHRVRLEGGLTEIRAADLRFTLDEARALLDAAGVKLPESALALLYARSEGWAAGLRLAALSLSGHPDPERFAEEFSGSERTVAEYLVAEVLERQPEEVRRLLLRTSVLERVSGELADLLTGGDGSERVLQDLERAGAFVVSLDARRSWFRYHQMFADLLQLELRGTAPDELPALHAAAAGWFAVRGFPVEAVRHAQAAQDWGLAARLLADHWVDLELDGQAATARELLARFPAGVAAADAELTALMAAAELTRGSLEEADRQLALATGQSGSVPADRHGRFQVLLAVLRLSVGRRQGNLPTVAEETDRLLAEVEAPGAAQLGLGADLRALALISLGIAEAFAARLEDADRHLEQGVALARRIGRPYLELLGLAHGAVAGNFRSYAVGAQRSRQAIELAQQHGWSEDQAAGVAYVILGGALVGQGRLAEAAPWLERAEQTLRVEAEPAAGMLLHYGRGLLELAGGGYREALADFQAAEQLADTLVTPHTLATRMRAHMLETLVRLGRTDGVEAALAGLDSREREGAEMRAVLAALRLAEQDALAATTALAPVIDGSVGGHPRWVMAGVLLEAIARDALGDQAAAGRALERALALAAPGSVLLPFLLHPAPGLLERHARQGTAHAALITEILGLLPRSGGRGSTDSLPARTASGGSGGYGGTDSPPMRRGPGGYGGMASPHERGGLGGSTPRLALREPLSEAETRVLRYLPTSLTVPEIANQLCLSANTIRTHMRHIYDKLDVHRRHEAVEGARTLGLLAPTAREPSAAWYPVHHIRGR